MIVAYAYLSLEWDDVEKFHVIRGYRHWVGKALWWELRDFREENERRYKHAGSVVGIHYQLYKADKWQARFLGLPHQEFQIHRLQESIAAIGCRIAAELFPPAPGAS